MRFRFSFPPLSIYAKLIAALLLVVMVPLLGTALYGNWVTGHIIQQRSIEAAQGDVAQHAQQISGMLNSIRWDVLYLSRLSSLRNYVAARAAQREDEIAYWREQMVEDFLVFASARPQYYQVRYLDEHGMEIVRIDSDGKTPYVIPEDRLQDKAHRYYFAETAQRSPGEIYVSPLDLNREHGQIEVSYRCRSLCHSHLLSGAFPGYCHH